MNWGTVLAIAFGLLLLAAPLAVLLRLRLRDSVPWSIEVIASRWRTASPETPVGIVALACRQMGIGLVGVSLLLRGLDVNGRLFVYGGILLLVGSSVLGWSWRGCRWIRRR